LGVQLAQLRPNALFDPLVYDTVEATRAALDERASLNQPFGQALLPQPTEGPTLLPDIPTPMLPTQPAGEWVTVTPSADVPGTTTPPAPVGTPQPSLEPIQPIAPTPGSLIGGA
jgi:hypothetical protein